MCVLVHTSKKSVCVVARFFFFVENLIKEPRAVTTPRLHVEPQAARSSPVWGLHLVDVSTLGLVPTTYTCTYYICTYYIH